MAASQTVTIVCTEGDNFTLEVDVANKSKMIRNLIADVGLSELKEIPLAGVSREVCTKVVEYMTHHKNDPEPTDDDDPRQRRTDDITDADKEFTKFAWEENNLRLLFELILAANYMDVKGLLDLMCKTFANMVKGKNPAQIRAMFGIDEFTPEEVEQVLKENEWAREPAGTAQ